RHQDVEQQRHQGALADAEQDETKKNGNLAPVVAHDEGEPQQRDGAERKAETSDLTRCQSVVEIDDQHRREEDREVERHHRDRCGDRRASLHDLDVERHREVQCSLQRDHREQRIDRAALLRRHDADHDHDRRRRNAQEIERRVGTGERQPPADEIVESEADQNDRAGGEGDANQINLDVGAAAVRLQAKAQQEDDRRHRDQDSERRPPADIGSKHSADHECEHAGSRTRRAERAEGRGLLAPGIIASEAKQSIVFPMPSDGLLRRFAPRNDGNRAATAEPLIDIRELVQRCAEDQARLADQRGSTHGAAGVSEGAGDADADRRGS
ncbi:hypothetical protein chiPu_0028339, partial [Chiloscyllium punctatum]|nr:hypothetical protein [Chiloscyllium punctatum]